MDIQNTFLETALTDEGECVKSEICEELRKIEAAKIQGRYDLNVKARRKFLEYVFPISAALAIISAGAFLSVSSVTFSSSTASLMIIATSPIVGALTALGLGLSLYPRVWKSHDEMTDLVRHRIVRTITRHSGILEAMKSVDDSEVNELAARIEELLRGDT